MSLLIPLIISDDPAVRDTSLDTLCAGLDVAGLQAECVALERFRHESESLYQRVRACFFLYAIHRFHLPTREGFTVGGHLPYPGYVHLLERRFEDAIAAFRNAEAAQGANAGISAGMATVGLGVSVELREQVAQGRHYFHAEFLCQAGLVGHQVDGAVAELRRLFAQPFQVPAVIFYV